MSSRFKPSASRKTMLLIAALFWTVVGFGLMIRGVGILLEGDYYILLAGAILLGTVKAVFIFERTVRKNVARIQEKEDGDCLGGVFSFKNWLLIVVMILMGRLLRLSGLPLGIYGVIVLAVGWGLFLASRIMWLEWKQCD
ncbi:MAG: hypothetical protein H8E41_04650 [Desulfobulbaceae bacterium]|uniref:Uncharacterized protein n=1 Tax=Candidatus Desulfobia pelagia TaxID=2841692 RepID=A0A8J6NE51_9BACT|nr:hypothetical protein [Candidatus Desulfobia pelagia]